MSGTLTADVGSLLDVVGGGWEHSALFRFLQEHHDAIVARQNGARMSWGRLCDWFAGAGLSNAHGALATPSCARKTWYRVRKTVAAMRRVADERAADLAVLEEQRQLEAEARREAVREQRRQVVQEQAALRVKMEQAERAAAYGRERLQSLNPVRPIAHQAAAIATPRAVTVIAPTAPNEGELPPVQKGDIDPQTLQPYRFGPDLPGYPSKRSYDMEVDWLRDVSRMIRARHPTNADLTTDEANTIMRGLNHRFITV